MSRLILPTAIAPMAVAILVTAPLQAQAQVISGDHFIQTHAGKCTSYWGESEGMQCYTTDGKTTYEDDTYGSDSGTWAVKGNEICVTWSKEQVEDCGPVEQVGDGIYKDGAYTWKLQ